MKIRLSHQSSARKTKPMTLSRILLTAFLLAGFIGASGCDQLQEEIDAANDQSRSYIEEQISAPEGDDVAFVAAERSLDDRR